MITSYDRRPTADFQGRFVRRRYRNAGRAPAAVKSAKPSVLLVDDAVTAHNVGNVRDLLKERVNVDFIATPTGPRPKLSGFMAEVVATWPKYQLIYFAYAEPENEWVESLAQSPAFRP